MEYNELRRKLIRLGILLLMLPGTSLRAQEDSAQLLKKAASGDAAAAVALCTAPQPAVADLIDQVRRWFSGNQPLIRECRKALARHEDPDALADLAADSYWGAQYVQLRAIQDLGGARNGETLRIFVALLDIEQESKEDFDVFFGSPATMGLHMLPKIIPEAGIPGPRSDAPEVLAALRSQWTTYFADHPDLLGGRADWADALEARAKRNDARGIMAAGLAMGSSQVPLLQSLVVNARPESGAWFGLEAVLARLSDAQAASNLRNGVGFSTPGLRPQYVDALAYTGRTEASGLCDVLGRHQEAAATVQAVTRNLSRWRNAPAASSAEWNEWCRTKGASFK